MAADDGDTREAMLNGSERSTGGQLQKDTKSQNKRKTPRKDPIDRGWAWVILGAVFFEMLISLGMMKSLGIFFVQFQRKFSSTSSETSLVVTFQSVAFSLVALPVMTIGLRVMSFRTSVLIGGAILGTVHVISAVAEDIRILYLSQGFLFGIGFAFIQPPVMTALGVYFDKRRGFAMNIAQMGAGIGALAFAPMLTKLFHEFGYFGSMLIVAGFHFNILISGALLRPLVSNIGTTRNDIEISKEKVDNSTEVKESIENKPKKVIKRPKHIAKNIQYRRGRNDSIDVGGHAKDRIPLQLRRLKSEANPDADIQECDQEVSPLALENARQKRFWKMSRRSPNASEESLNTKAAQRFTKLQVPLLARSVSCEPEDHVFNTSVAPRYRTSSLSDRRQHSTAGPSSDVAIKREADPSTIARFPSYELVGCSIIDLSLPERTRPVLNEAGQDVSCIKGVKANIVNILAILFDVKLIKNPLFVLYLTSSTFLCAGSSTVSAFVAPHAQDIGIDDIRIALALSVMNVMDLLSRLLFGLIADTGWIRRSHILALSNMVLGIACLLLYFVTSFTTMMVFSVIMGLLSGVYFAFYAVVIVDYLSVDNLKNSIGFTVLFQGVGSGVAFPLVGILRDATGTYVASYIFIAATLIVGSILAFLLPVLQKALIPTDGQDKQDGDQHTDNSTAAVV